VKKTTDGSSTNGDGQQEPRRILVVDDDVATAKAMHTILEDAGYEALLCHMGNDALKAARTSQPAAALIDVHLPDVNGLILAQQMRNILGPEKPIIMVSGDTSMETLNSLSHVGATYFFSKPMNAGSLLERLRQCLA
jgi:DNA-binding response OmpR family regulator